MKRIVRNVFALIMIASTLCAFAQTDSRPVAVQAGTGHLINGKCNIKLSEQTAPDGYFVSITPRGETKGLYVTKSEGAFVVKGNQTEKVDFDYVIFVNVPVQPQATMLIKNRVPPSK